MEEIDALRQEDKFSDELQKVVMNYLHENLVEYDRFQKPEFGRKMAETILVEELRGIESLRILVEKISRIVD